MIGINCIGYLSANFGLGIAARNTVRLLLEKGYDVAIADLQLPDGRSAQDHTFDRLLHQGDGPLPHPINLFHCNPPQIGPLLKNTPSQLLMGGRLNVCVPFWEQTALPASWVTPLEAMDLVLCPSRFIEQAVVSSCRGPLPNVRHFPQTTFLPEGHKPDRRKFGLPEQGVLFIQSFEAGNECDRKNPWGAIESFNRAFGPNDNAYLVIKLNNSAGANSPPDRLREYASANNKIIVLDRIMHYVDALSLYESCDCLVSLHRSEGLGLAPMEAMLLGKPVVATAWSGNTDFMDEHNSCLVGFRLVPVDSPLYKQIMDGRAVQWADPDLAQAVSWMRRLYENEALRKKIGASARESMVRRQEECKKNDVFTVVEELWFLKQSRNSRRNTVLAPASRFKSSDQSAFFASISKLLEENDPAGAFDLYCRSRDSFKETPEMVEVDEIMRRIKSLI